MIDGAEVACSCRSDHGALPDEGKSMFTLTDADGATAWVTGNHDLMHDPELLAQIGPLLEEGMQRLRRNHGTLDRHDR